MSCLPFHTSLTLGQWVVIGQQPITHYHWQTKFFYLLFTKIYYLLYIIHLLRRNCGPKILVRAAHIIKRRSADRSVLLIICVRPRLAAAVGWVGLWRISRDCVGAGSGHWTLDSRDETTDEAAVNMQQHTNERLSDAVRCCHGANTQ